MTEQPYPGDEYVGVLLETCVDESISRPRVRPIEVLPSNMRVEFPRKLRDNSPLGTRFRADLRVAQKTNRSDGAPRGNPYLVADKHSIVLEENFEPDRLIHAVKISDRYYDYVEEYRARPETAFYGLRDAAYRAAGEQISATSTETTARSRNETIKQYALVRSNGVCEGCEEPAPFIAKNGKPYLEVHHIVALSSGGADSPDNVAAVCPNCHRRVDFGEDSDEFNELILEQITRKEFDLGNT